MSPALLVARRELRERRFLVLTAFALGALPFVIRWLPFWWGPDIGDDLALLLGLSFPPAAALAVGASIFGRDASENRLRFYFARPLSAGALWGGKCLAAGVLIFVAFVCTFVPALLTESVGGWRLRDVEALRMGGGLLCALLFLAGLAHVASSLYRTRSRWLVADLLLGVIVVALFVAMLRQLLLVGAGRALFSASAWFLLAGSAVCLAAAAAQLAFGHADVRRGRAALSAVLWPLSAVVLVGFWGFGAWLRSIGPGQLGVGYPGFVAPQGPGLMFGPGVWQGRAGFAPCFLINGETGAWTQISKERLGDPAFDREGRMAVWVSPGVPLFFRAIASAADVDMGFGQPEMGGFDISFPGWRTGTLLVARFGEGAPSVEERSLEPDHAWGAALAVDASGTRAVLTDGAKLAIVEIASRHVVAATEIDADAAEFLDDGRIRVYSWETAEGQAPQGVPTWQRPGVLIVVDWNPADGSRVEKSRAQGEGWLSFVEHAGDVAVAWVGRDDRLLLDLAAGTSQLFRHVGGARILANGDVALMLPDELRVVSPSGKTVSSFAENRKADTIVESQPGEIAVGLFDPFDVGFWRTKFVDAGSGRLLREERALRPAGSSGRATPRPGSFGAQLFFDKEGSLIRLLPDGTRRVLVAGVE